MDIIETVIGLFMLVVVVALFIGLAAEDGNGEGLQVYDFQGTIVSKEVKQYSGGIFGASDDYFFVINVNNTTIVQQVHFEDYLLYEEGDTYDFVLNNLFEKKELRKLGAIE